MPTPHSSKPKRKATLLTQPKTMPSDFSMRHIGVSDADVAEMLSTLSLDSIDALIEQTIPASLPRAPQRFEAALSEPEALARLSELGAQNQLLTSMIGCGYYGTHMPAVIRRNALENPDWYTAYTPYQPEISQGRLEMLTVFQQMVMDLTGLTIANASMLDEATAAAEAMMMSKRLAKSKAEGFFIDQDCHPQTIAVVQTRAEALGYPTIVGDPLTDLDASTIFGGLFQYPGTSGAIVDYREQIAALHDQQAFVTMAADILALTLLTPPGELGADIAVGSTQRFGIPMGYGGPHAAYFATQEIYKRSMPGRLIGVSIDSQGKQAYRMALQTREQHIRREKATSNICTSQVLLAVMAAMYAVYHGPKGVQAIAESVHVLCCRLAKSMLNAGFEIKHKHFFDTLQFSAPGQSNIVIQQALDAGINLRAIDDNTFGMSLDETTTEADVERLLAAIAPETQLAADPGNHIPESLQRSSDFLTHPTFSLYRNETAMMRYLRQLSRKDITLARSMIPLGSCTMKLNAAAEMESVSNPAFANLHPFVPINQAAGYQQLIQELADDLCEITGYDGLSMQPNAGSQGEYAGLLTIRAYHLSRGDSDRTICLIPSSAHGTNPASAVMAGMKVVIIKCLDNGNIDIDDLRTKAEQHSDQLAAMMVTYPSTFGVFEAEIRTLCDLIHEHGGQVYLDGANMNAMVGLCRPGDLGSDVSHLNLHKTFAIPHGGGGPGMGPIGVKKHLIPFLPAHSLVDGVNPAKDAQPIGSVSAAPWGSPLILPISWAYIKMLGTEGLLASTKIAILNSNYIATRLADHFPVRYTGENGRVAHECIIDCHAFKESCGISVEDIAKRLIDYGFHSPTMSWPVADSLMIEPTESEPKAEIDRFIEAMIAIRAEIAEIESGKADHDNNLLKNAPHSHSLIATDKWPFLYSREQAFFPAQQSHDDKYWPPVGRLDNIYGDRNLFCSCPAIESYEQET